MKKFKTGNKFKTKMLDAEGNILTGFIRKPLNYNLYEVHFDTKPDVRYNGGNQECILFDYWMEIID